MKRLLIRLKRLLRNMGTLLANSDYRLYLVLYRLAGGALLFCFRVPAGAGQVPSNQKTLYPPKVGSSITLFQFVSCVVGLSTNRYATQVN